MAGRSFASQLLFKIDHVRQLDAALINRVAVVVRKKVFDGVGADKTAFLIKRNGQRAVACPDL